jgi:hypothetical protein
MAISLAFNGLRTSRPFPQERPPARNPLSLHQMPFSSSEPAGDGLAHDSAKSVHMKKVSGAFARHMRRLYVGSALSWQSTGTRKEGDLHMSSQKKLIEAFGELGEAACIYKGEKLLFVNDRFASMFDRAKESFEDLPINEIVHNDSMEMIQDFRRRRVHDERGVPTTYTAYFKTDNDPRMELQLFVLRLKESEGEVLVIVRQP